MLTDNLFYEDEVIIIDEIRGPSNSTNLFHSLPRCLHSWPTMTPVFTKYVMDASSSDEAIHDRMDMVMVILNALEKTQMTIRVNVVSKRLQINCILGRSQLGQWCSSNPCNLRHDELLASHVLCIQYVLVTSSLCYLTPGCLHIGTSHQF